LPIYCRLLQKGIEQATFKPLIDDNAVSTHVHAPALGDFRVSVNHLKIAKVQLVGCAASVDEKGLFNVGVTRMDLELGSLVWKYLQTSYPHMADNGNATGTTSISFNMSIDTNTAEQHVFSMKIGNIDFALHATHHKILTPALMKLTELLRPLISEAVRYEADKSLKSTLAIIAKDGGCGFLSDVLKGFNMSKLQFTSDKPHTTHVPVVGQVEISVNSSYVTQPTGMQCKHIGYTGNSLVVHIENVPFDAGFVWSYLKKGSSFWHNKGTGAVKVVAGTFIHIDMLKPKQTDLSVDLPVLKVDIKADADAWMYDALSGALFPLVRESLQHFGGGLLTRYIRKCLADPTCPHLHPHVASPANDIIVV